MDLYLIRHGESEGTERPDEQRALTPQGCKGVGQLAAYLAKRGERPHLLFSSPLVRARQTAEPFAKAWGVSIETVDWLRPMIQPSEVLEVLRRTKDPTIALIGHLPNLGLLLGTLVWGLPPREVILPTGGVAFLTLPTWEPGEGRLRWLMVPEIVEKPS